MDVNRRFKKWLILYGILALGVILPSFWAWFQTPLVITRYEFDFFLGYFERNGSALDILLLMCGKFLFGILFLILGYIFYRISCILLDSPEQITWSTIICGAMTMVGIFFIGLPFLSPDVMFYLANGWMQAVQHVSPFEHSIGSFKDWATTPALLNVYPGFVNTKGNYGPFFHLICTWIMFLAQNSVVTGLLLFKMIASLSLLASGGIFSRIAHLYGRNPKAVFFLFTANPLCLFNFATCGHNDTWMLVTIAAAFWFMLKQCPLLSGLFLGMGFSIKLIPLLLVPVVLLWFFKKLNGFSRYKAAGIVVAGFLIAAAFFYSLIPEAFSTNFKLLTYGFQHYRSSVYLLLVPMAETFGGDFLLVNNVLRMAFVFTCLVLGIRHLFIRIYDVWHVALLAALVLMSFISLYTPLVEEWYFSWIVLFCFFIQRPLALNAAMVLCVFYPPLTIFMIRSPLFFAGISQSIAMALTLGAFYMLLKLEFCEEKDTPPLSVPAGKS